VLYAGWKGNVMRICVVGLSVLVLTTAQTLAGAELVFEELGVPCWVKTLAFRLLTQHADGHYTAWATYEDADTRGLVGVRTDTGERLWVDLNRYGASHIAPVRGMDGNLYAYVGNPAHFIRYDIATGEVTDLGIPASPANYFGGGAMAPDGKFYVGSYPATYLVRCDTATGEIESLGRIAEDDRQCYIYPCVAVSDNGIVYCPVGLHHQELWAYDTKSGAKKQILPDEMTGVPGAPKVWRAADGQVYARSGGTSFLCQPDRIVRADGLPDGGRILGPEPTDLVAGGKRVGEINEAGKLALTDVDTGETTLLQTDYQGRPLMVYCVACERDGKIFGGTFSPAHTFSYDPGGGELYDYGRISTGSVQVYDMINTPKGLLMGSYSGAWTDLWDPAKPLEEGVNPYRFERNPTQERPLQWAIGPDGCFYTGTMPVKGHLGGALARVNLEEMSVKWWRNVIENQSVVGCAAVPETGELFCTSTISGGSSAKPSEKEAFVFLWDCAGEKVSFTAQPVPGATSYGQPVRARNGLIYGLAAGKYYAFDPVKRETVFVGEVPVTGAKFPGLHQEPVGEKGLIYGLIEDAIVAIDPADNSFNIMARHESIKRAHGFMITGDGVLYYGCGPKLWRCRLLP